MEKIKNLKEIIKILEDSNIETIHIRIINIWEQEEYKYFILGYVTCLYIQDIISSELKEKISKLL